MGASNRQIEAERQTERFKKLLEDANLRKLGKIIIESNSLTYPEKLISRYLRLNHISPNGYDAELIKQNGNGRCIFWAILYQKAVMAYANFLITRKNQNHAGHQTS